MSVHLELTNTRVLLTAHLGKPRKVVGDGGGAALDLHQWDLIFSCHQDVFLVVEHSSQVHTPNEINEMDQIKRKNLYWLFKLCVTVYFDLC